MNCNWEFKVEYSTTVSILFKSWHSPPYTGCPNLGAGRILEVQKSFSVILIEIAIIGKGEDVLSNWNEPPKCIYLFSQVMHCHWSKKRTHSWRPFFPFISENSEPAVSTIQATLGKQAFFGKWFSLGGKKKNPEIFIFRWCFLCSRNSWLGKKLHLAVAHNEEEMAFSMFAHLFQHFFFVCISIHGQLNEGYFKLGERCIDKTTERCS